MQTVSQSSPQTIACNKNTLAYFLFSENKFNYQSFNQVTPMRKTNYANLKENTGTISIN